MATLLVSVMCQSPNVTEIFPSYLCHLCSNYQFLSWWNVCHTKSVAIQVFICVGVCVYNCPCVFILVMRERANAAVDSMCH